MSDQIPAWRIMGASVAGTSHLKRGQGCDDAHAYKLLPNGGAVFVAADGAGSAKYGGEGAKVAAETSIGLLSSELATRTIPLTEEDWREVLLYVVRETRHALERLLENANLDRDKLSKSEAKSDNSSLPTLSALTELLFDKEDSESGGMIVPPTAFESRTASAHVASDQSYPEVIFEAQGSELNGADGNKHGQFLTLRDFATTLLLACVYGDQVAYVQIGDGAVVLQHADGTLQVLEHTKRGEYINETQFLTDRDYLEESQCSVLDFGEFSGISLLTDGVEMLAISLGDNTAHRPFFTPLFTFARKDSATEDDLVEFLSSDRVSARTDDDKTLVIGVRSWPSID